MSQENVEIVRRVYALLTAGDPTAMDLVAPDFVVDFSRRRVDPFVLSRDEARVGLEGGEYLEPWTAPPTWEPEELIDAGDKVFVFLLTKARGKASGAEVIARVANVWTFREGQAVEMKYFGEDRSAALEAAGLAE